MSSPRAPRKWASILKDRGLFAFLTLFILELTTARLWATADPFFSVSDDDFARLVIAQRFVELPTLDPSRSSWLPFPFYVQGLVMQAFGATLEIGRQTALFQSAIGALLLYLAARHWGVSRRSSLISAWVACQLPSIRPFTIATVPEFATSAATVFALAVLTGGPASPESALPLSNEGKPDKLATPRLLERLGWVALWAATWSRYETWPIAFGLCFTRLLRSPRRGLFGLEALIGPTTWMGLGWVEHGDPLFFIGRVRAYKAALGDDPRALFEVLTTFPRAFVEFEPLLVGVSLVAALGLFWTRHRSAKRSPLWHARIALGLFAFMVLALTSADLHGGAATHHPERLLLGPWLVLALTTPATLFGLWKLPKGPEATTRSLRSLVNARPHFIAAATVVTVLSGAIYAQNRRPSPHYTNRSDAVEFGLALRRIQSSPERTLIATADYGYFAIMAAAGKPERFGIAKTHDPRTSDGVPLPLAVRRELARTAYSWLVLPLCIQDLEGLPLDSLLVYESEDFALLRLRQNSAIAELSNSHVTRYLSAK